MNTEKNTQLTIPHEMAEAIYQDLAAEERAARLKETADQVVNHSFTRLYTEGQLAEIRANISELCVKISDYERELAAIKARYKSLISPLENDRETLVGDLRTGGVFVTEECYVFLNFNIGKAGLYNSDGILLKTQDITPEMSQATIFSALRGGSLRKSSSNRKKKPRFSLLPARKSSSLSNPQLTSSEPATHRRLQAHEAVGVQRRIVHWVSGLLRPAGNRLRTGRGGLMDLGFV